MKIDPTWHPSREFKYRAIWSSVSLVNFDQSPGKKNICYPSVFTTFLLRLFDRDYIDEADYLVWRRIFPWPKDFSKKLTAEQSFPAGFDAVHKLLDWMAEQPSGWKEDEVIDVEEIEMNEEPLPSPTPDSSPPLLPSSPPPLPSSPPPLPSSLPPQSS